MPISRGMPGSIQFNFFRIQLNILECLVVCHSTFEMLSSAIIFVYRIRGMPFSLS